MCVIVVKPKDQNFSDEDFVKCWNRNGHGLGYAFIQGDEIKHEKGLMVLKKALKKTKTIRKKGVDAVFHFRIQSRGGVSAELTHPFSFSQEDNQRLLFHNGTVSQIRSGKTSDSAVLAQTLLAPLKTESVYTILEKLKPSRFVTVVKEDGKAPEIRVFGGDGSGKVGGLWYSNFMHFTHKGSMLQYGD